MNLTERNGAVMLGLLNEAFNMFCDTLNYPIADVHIVPTSQPFTLLLEWKCAPMWETGNAYEIRAKLQTFALDLFKQFAYLVRIDHPEQLDGK